MRTLVLLLACAGLLLVAAPAAEAHSGTVHCYDPVCVAECMAARAGDLARGEPAHVCYWHL